MIGDGIALPQWDQSANIQVDVKRIGEGAERIFEDGLIEREARHHMW